jgi:hypothetical protein
MRCPKCNFAQADSGTECLKCGIVFAKYLSVKNQASGKSAVILQLDSLKEVNHHSSNIKAYLKNLLFYINPEIGIYHLIGRVFVLLVIIVWGLKFIFSSIESNYSGVSFMHLINLPFHEAGHMLFRIFGQFLMTLGGSLTQCLVPLICLLTFLLKTKDPFAASISLWWLGENLIDLAPYINDARALKLMLLGGVTGRDIEDYHDWELILRKLSLLEYDHVIAETAHVAGSLLMICAFIWGGSVLLIQYRNRLSYLGKSDNTAK